MPSKGELQKKIVDAVDTENISLLSQLSKEAEDCGYFELSYYCRGLIEQFGRKYVDSIVLFNKAIEIDPSNLKVLYALSSSFFKLKKYEEVIEVSLKALRNGGNEKVLFYNIGLAYGLSGKYKEAISYFVKALEKDPEYIQTYLKICESAFRLKKMDICKSYMEKAYERFKNEESQKQKLSMLLSSVGSYCFANDDVSGALSVLDKAIELQDLAMFHVNKAQCFLRNKKYSDAFIEGEKAVELDKGLAYGYYVKAESAILMGNDRIGLDNLKEALKCNENIVNYIRKNDIFRKYRFTKTEDIDEILKQIEKIKLNY